MVVELFYLYSTRFLKSVHDLLQVRREVVLVDIHDVVLALKRVQLSEVLDEGACDVSA